MKKRLQLVGIVLLALVMGAFIRPYLEEVITRQHVQAAATLSGLSFTESEIDSLLPNLKENLDEYQAMRKQSIPNSLAPALVFNPIPPGFKIPNQPAKPALNTFAPVLSKNGTFKRPKQDEELAFLTVRELAELIKTRQISSEELTRFFLRRLHQHDSTLHCVISFTEERALAQAKAMDIELKQGKYRGLLHGIPYGAKDLLAAKGYKTTWGATPYKEQQFDYDAAVIEKLDAAGAVLVAKLSLGALAWGDVWFNGMTRNPWNTEQGSSGSSAGSASAVAAGLLPFAIGTETLGSIVSPSTVCGTTGLRPTFGQVSRHGAMALSWSMDKIGPIARSVEDCAIVFAAIQGHDPRDPHSLKAGFLYQHNLAVKSLTIGYEKKAFEANYPFKEQDSIALDALRKAGFKLVPVELPEMPPLGIILEAEAAAAFDDLTRSNRDDELVRQIRNAWPNVFRQARFIPAVEYIQANRLRSQLITDMQAVFKQVDVYVHPSWGSSSLRITNYTGHPCVVLPNGFRENGTPTSISFTGKLFDEGRLLAVANAWQKGTNHHKQHPTAFLK